MDDIVDFAAEDDECQVTGRQGLGRWDVEVGGIQIGEWRAV